MRVVVDGLALRGTSVSIVTEQLLAAWAAAFPDDDVHVVLAPDAAVSVPASVTAHVLELGPRRALGRIWHQNRTLPRICRQVGAEALLATVPSTAASPVPCPRVLIQHDLQHEFLPENFSWRLRTVRGTAYTISFRQATAVACVTAKTRAELLRSRPFLRSRQVRVIHHGTDHVERLRAIRSPGGYAIAFGQYRNKNVDLLLRSWQHLVRSGTAVPLHIIGLDDRDAVLDQARALGIADHVLALPWLSADAYESEFANADVLVFLSSYEGFGLPVMEAMRLEIPVVITPEPAVVEVAGGHAIDTGGWTPEDVSAAVDTALQADRGALAAARAHAQTMTWHRAAVQYRDLLGATR